MLKKFFEKIVKSNIKILLLNLESLKKWAILSNFLNSEEIVPGGYQENRLTDEK
jgi:hypothetical protein